MESEQLLYSTFNMPAGFNAATCCVLCLCSSGHERGCFTNPQPPPTSLSNYSSVNPTLHTPLEGAHSLGQSDMNQERMLPLDMMEAPIIRQCDVL